MLAHLKDTIVALATPQGTGALGVIRISGPHAISIADNIFYGKNLLGVEGHTVHYGKIKDENAYIIDECLATVFKAPRSFTKENIVEFSCHGSAFILNEIIQLIIRNGARMAQAGEFSLRAFLNGQFDLSQAEAIADLIASTSRADHDLAMRQMRGGFSDKIQQLRQELIDFAALIELELDFGEEDVEFADRAQLEKLVEDISTVIRDLLDSFVLGNVLKNGVSTVIAGRPNAGKSTLLNALLNEDRALVSEVEGTTRDTVEETLNIEGITFRLIDTAGIRKTEDTVEQLGVKRTLSKIEQSTVILYVFDVTQITPEDLWSDVELFLNKHEGLGAQGGQIFLANKMDLNPYVKPEIYYKKDLIDSHQLLSLSAKNEMNIEALKNMMYQMIISNPEMLDNTIVSNNRHYEALHQAHQALENVLNALRTGLTGDLVAMDIRQSLHYLGEITGEIHTDDLLDSIFSRFCIGK